MILLDPIFTLHPAILASLIIQEKAILESFPLRIIEDKLQRIPSQEVLMAAEADGEYLS